jgi:hypothetical protein
MADMLSISSFDSGNPNSLQGTGLVVYLQATWASGATTATIEVGGLKQTDFVRCYPQQSNSATGFSGFYYDNVNSTFSDTNGIAQFGVLNAAPNANINVCVEVWHV